MKEHDVRQRIESFLKRTAREVVIPASVGLGLALTIAVVACSQGGASQDATAGSMATSQGGTGDSTSSQGGAGGCPYIDLPYAAFCNTGDQQVTAGPGFDASGLCPSNRECYTLQGSCGSIVCLLPEGVHCNDLLSCNPGDTPTPQRGPDCVGYPSPCYTKYLCAQSITCRNSASPYGGICTGTWSDGGILEPPDASAGSDDAGTRPCCGDGVPDYQYGEQCDLGPLNGVPLNTNESSPSFWDPDPNGIVLCDSNCTNPNALCDLDWKGGIICD